jgi:hypothetical protein
MLVRRDFQRGIGRRALTEHATDYLMSVLYDDRGRANETANAFVEYATGRAWVFTDIGLSPEGEPIYAFTHRTFLEYFAATHIARDVADVPSLVERLSERIAEAEWDMVAQLSAQIVTGARDGAPDELLRQVLERGATESAGGLSYRTLNLVGYIARCLEFLLPSSRATRALMRSMLDLELARGQHGVAVLPERPPEEPIDAFNDAVLPDPAIARIMRRRRAMPSRSSHVPEPMEGLLSALNRSNPDVFIDLLAGFGEWLSAAAADPTRSQESVTLSVALLMRVREERHRDAATVVRRVLEASDAATATASSSLPCALQLLSLKVVEIDRLLAAHGVDGAFALSSLPSWTGGAAVPMLAEAAIEGFASMVERAGEWISEIGSALAADDRVASEYRAPARRALATATLHGFDFDHLPVSVREGLTLIILALVERYASDDEALAIVDGARGDAVSTIRTIVSARRIGQRFGDAEVEKFPPGFRTATAAVIAAWMRRELSFVNLATTTRK